MSVSVVELHRSPLDDGASLSVSMVVADPLRLDIRILEGGVPTANGITLDASALHVLAEAIVEAAARVDKAGAAMAGSEL